MLELIGQLDTGQTATWLTSAGEVVSNNNRLSVTEAGTYFYQVSNRLNGCVSALDEVVVTDNTQLPSAAISADPNTFLDCISTSINLSAQPQPGTIFTWNNGEVTIQARENTITSSGLYILTVLDTITGCRSSDSIIIEDFEEYPFIQVNPPNDITCANPTILIDASSSQGGQSIRYQWFDENFQPITGATRNSFAADSPGIYYLRLQDTLNGCENIDTIAVGQNIEPPEAALDEVLRLNCLETDTSLQAFTANDLTTVDISWSTTDGQIISGQGSLRPEVSGTGQYFLRLRDLTNGCVSTDSILVINNPDVPERAVFEIQDENCEGGNDGVFSSLEVRGGIAPYSYSLGGGNTFNGLLSDLSPGSYELNITDSNGCSIDTNFVISTGTELNVALPPLLEIGENERGRLRGITNLPEDSLLSIQWSPASAVDCPDCLETTFQASATENLTLSIISLDGCTATASIQVLVTPLPDVYIPNAFSPNGDGRNDLFRLFANERITTIEKMIIADRWGELVFQQEDFDPNSTDFGWDGNFLGKPMNPGVYVYFFRVRSNTGELKTFKGDVVLMR